MDKDFDDSWIVPARPARLRAAPEAARERSDSAAPRPEPVIVRAPRPEPIVSAAPEPHDSDYPSGARGGVPGRRTITIRGQVQRPASRRPPRTVRERAGSRPDRIAMWAVLLGFLLLLVAATSSHAAVLHTLAGSLH